MYSIFRNLALILISAKFFALLARKCRAPQVVGEIIVNRTEHIIVEPLASGKHTEVNPMGFTIVVEEVGHNPNHSYYDYK